MNTVVLKIKDKKCITLNNEIKLSQMNFHKNYKELSKSAKMINADNLKTINLSILGNHSTHFFTKSIKDCTFSIIISSVEGPIHFSRPMRLW